MPAEKIIRHRNLRIQVFECSISFGGNVMIPRPDWYTREKLIKFLDAILDEGRREKLREIRAALEMDK